MLLTSISHTTQRKPCKDHHWSLLCCFSVNLGDFWALLYQILSCSFEYCTCMYATLLFIHQHAMSIPRLTMYVCAWYVLILATVPAPCCSGPGTLQCSAAPSLWRPTETPTWQCKTAHTEYASDSMAAVSCYKTVCKTGQRGEQQGSVCMSGCSWPWQQGRAWSGWTLWACWLPSRWWHQRPGSFSYTMRWFHFSPQGTDRSLEGSVHTTTDGGNRGERTIK